MPDAPLLRVEDLVKWFPVTAGVMGRVVAQVKAVDGVSFEIESGTTLGLVGESGCGKSTVGQSLMRLIEPTAGSVYFEGANLCDLSPSELRDMRRNLQIVFQDPFNSLNPRMTVTDIVGEAMRIHGLATRRDVEKKVAGVLDRVGIPSAWMNRYPHEFSGGQRQRISIARAIALEPKLIVCDEAVSALDVSIQAQVINLLIDLQNELGLSYLFISHDLSVVKHISDRIAVMYLGQIVENAPADSLFAAPAHPYTRALLSAIPVADPERRSERIVLEGDVPTPLDPPPGCRFHTRCPAVMARCRGEEPSNFELPGDRSMRCFLGESVSGERWHEEIERLEEAAQSANPARRAHEPAAVDSDHGGGWRDREAAAAASIERIEDQTAGLTGRVALASTLVGAALFASGLTSAGAVWIAASAWLALRPRIESAPARAALLVLAVGLASAFAAGIDAQRLVSQAQRQLTGLQAALDDAAAARGHYPDTLSELGWRLPEIVGSGEARDPWGGHWLYQPPAQAGARPVLGSTGRDRLPGGGDDIGRLPEPAS